jgi:hypothetical protein
MPLTRREQETGCAAHLYIPDLIPGEQLDAGEDWVSYRLPDGTEWRDGVPTQASPPVICHRACRHCGATSYRVGPGKGPHLAALTCTACDGGKRWLSKADGIRLGVCA